MVCFDRENALMLMMLKSWSNCSIIEIDCDVCSAEIQTDGKEVEETCTRRKWFLQLKRLAYKAKSDTSSGRFGFIGDSTDLFTLVKNIAKQRRYFL